MKSFLIAFLALPVLMVVDLVEVDKRTATEASPAGMPEGECSGCNGTRGSAYSNDACITIQETGVGIGPGACTGEQSPCNATPCDLSGVFSITIGGGAPCVIYRRTRINNTCVPGTTVYQPGDTDTTNYNGQTLDCGVTVFERFYVTDPGNTCNINAAAGWSFTCSECKFVHG